MVVAGDWKFFRGDIVTLEVELGVTKGQLVYLSAEGKVKPTDATHLTAVGIAEQTREAGQKVPVILMSPVIYLTASGSITFGEWVVAADAGNVAAFDKTAVATGTKEQNLVGIAWKTVSDGEVVPVQLAIGINFDTGYAAS